MSIDDIKKQYSVMTDEELLKLDRYEDHDLTAEAFSALQEELSKRKIKNPATDALDLNIDSAEKRRLIAVKERISKEYVNATWNYIFDAKDKGTSNAEIAEGLIAKGFGKDDVDKMIKTMAEKARQRQKQGKDQMLWGGIACVAGILITYITYKMADERGGSFIIAWGAIIFGAIFFFRGLALRDKHARVLTVIEDEELD